MNLLAAQNQQEAAFFAVLIAVAAVMIVIQLILSAAICFFIGKWLGRVPVEHRRMEPGTVWLLMIPCFNLFWNFTVFLKVPASFKSYFESVGSSDVGDCGRGIGLWFAICSALCLVPVVQYFAGLAALVLLIMCLVKFHELQSRIPAGI